MKRRNQSLIWLAGTALLASTCTDGFADAKVNPYEMIVERNPFGLKPPPPPAPPEDNTPKAPPAPLATVELTGITSMFSKPRALFEIIPGPGKPMLKPILSEGEKLDNIEVVSIDVEKNQVTVRNAGVTTNLTFKVAKAGSTPPPPGAPGLPPPGIPVVPPPAQTSFNYNQAASGRGVMMSGGVPAAGGDGFRSIPSRNIRAAGQQGEQPPMTAIEHAYEIEKNSANNPHLPFPPTILNPTRNVALPGADTGSQYPVGRTPQNQPTLSSPPTILNPGRNLTLPPPPGG